MQQHYRCSSVIYMQYVYMRGDKSIMNPEIDRNEKNESIMNREIDRNEKNKSIINNIYVVCRLSGLQKMTL